MLLLEDFAEVAESASVEALRASIERLTSDLEFERYGLMLIAPDADARMEWRGIDNLPAGYREDSTDPEATSICPVMRHAKSSSVPLYWDRETYARAGRQSNWEQQMPWGYGTGFIACAHLNHDRHVMIGIEREKPLTDTPEKLAHKFSAFQLFAACTVDVSVALFSPESQAPGECPLTKRELEALQWTLNGKTAWEVGEILGIAHRTVALYVSTAAQKLGAVNKHQAALKALRLGWIR